MKKTDTECSGWGVFFTCLLYGLATYGFVVLGGYIISDVKGHFDRIDALEREVKRLEWEKEDAEMGWIEIGRGVYTR